MIVVAFLLHPAPSIAFQPVGTALGSLKINRPTHEMRPFSTTCLKAENSEGSKGFVLPSINQILLAWVTVLSGSRLMESVPKFLKDPSIEYLGLNLAFNCVLLSGSCFLLMKTLQKIDYAGLGGLEEKSLAKQAGVWALASTVPTSFEGYQVASFAGGCFWGTELHYQRIPGVVATCVGYTQGGVSSPTYEQVCSGSTGHAEGIQLIYDPSICSYERLLSTLFNTVDPTLLNRVGNDRGTQYRHGVYTHTPEQTSAAKRFVSEVQGRYENPVVTEVLPAKVFWPAEDYHQRYLEKRGQSAEKNCEESVRCYG